MKLIAQPMEYQEDFAKAYGDTFTVWGSKNTPIVYFSHPQALQQIFTADPRHLESGLKKSEFQFLLGANSLMLLSGDRLG